MLVLRRGDKGSFVRLLQERLNFHGSYLGQDGVFGRKTERVLMDFQSSWNLVVDGVCGDLSWSCLLQSKGLSRGGAYMRKRQPELIGDILRNKAMESGVSEACLRLCLCAVSDVGKEENPFGRNKGKAISHLVQGTSITGVSDLEFSEYKRHWGISNRAFFPAWCAIAVSSWMAGAFGASEWSEIPFGNWFGGVTQTMKWADAGGGLRREVGDCEMGELFVMPRAGSGSDGDDGDGAKIRGGHIGIILWDDGDSVQTVEGNTQNGVRLRTRKKSTLWGVINWERASSGTWEL